jgi:hypothetical protein
MKRALPSQAVLTKINPHFFYNLHSASLRACDRHHLARWGRIKVSHILERLDRPLLLFGEKHVRLSVVRIATGPKSGIAFPLTRQYHLLSGPSRRLPHGFYACQRFRCLPTCRRSGSPHIFLSLSWCITSVHYVKELFSFHIVEGGGVEPPAHLSSSGNHHRGVELP